MAESKKKVRNPVQPAAPKRESVSIRQIDNGYLVQRSALTKGGKYQETEQYYASKPVITASSPGAGKKAPTEKSKPATAPVGEREVGYLKGR